jgi:hypothetical protein
MPSIADLRAKLPELNGLDDNQALDAIHQAYYPGVDKALLAGKLGVKLQAPTAKGEQGDFSRGFEKAMLQVPQTAGGALALAGDMVGADGVRDYGLNVYQRNADKIAAISKPTDSLSAVMEDAPDTSAADWIQNAAGYTAGQALQAVATGGVGGFIGKQLALRGIKGVAERAAASQLAKQVAGRVAQRGAMIGAASGMGASNLMQEAGSIYPEALAQAAQDGRELDTGDKARVLGSAVAAAAVDTGMDTLMAGRLLHGGRRVLTDSAGKVMRDAAGAPLVEGMARAARREIPGAMAREAVTEGIQTGIERAGARQDLSSADAIRDYVDSMGVGAVGGGLGGAAAILHKQKVPESGPLSRAANAGIEAQAAAIDADPEPVQTLGDGSQVHKAKLAAYLNQFMTPDQRTAAQNQLMGLDENGKPIKPEPAEPPKFADTPAQEQASLAAWGAEHSPATLAEALALKDAPGSPDGLMVAPHPDGGGYTLVPSNWLTLDSQAKFADLQKPAPASAEGKPQAPAAAPAAEPAPADAPAEPEWKTNPYTAYKYADQAGAEKFFANKKIDPALFHVGQNERGAWVIKKNVAPAPITTTEATDATPVPANQGTERGQGNPPAAPGRDDGSATGAVAPVPGPEQAPAAEAGQPAAADPVRPAGGADAEPALTEGVADVPERPQVPEEAPVAAGEKGAPQAEAEPAVADTQAFAPESGTLGIPREQMPQVPTQAHGGLVRHLNAQGIEHETKMVPADELKPTQAEFSPAKVEAAKEAPGDRAVIVSNDGHIIDGHHQVLAAQAEGKDVKAIVLDAPVQDALAAVRNSPSATTATDKAAQPAIERHPVKIVKATGSASADAAKTLAALPPVADGHMRLYRAESPTVKFEDVFKADGLADFKADLPGARYTPDFKYADYYRQSYGSDAAIHYIDVLKAVAEKGKVNESEYAIEAPPAPAIPAKSKALAERDRKIAARKESAAPQPAPAKEVPAPTKPKKTGGQRARERLQRDNPFLAFLAQHGVSLNDKAESGMEKGRRGNPMLPGYGPLFRRTGLRLDELALLAHEAGFLTAHDIESIDDTGGTRKLADMINRAAQNKEVIREANDAADALPDADAQLMDEAQRLGVETAGKTADQVYDAVVAAHADQFSRQEQELAGELVDDDIPIDGGIPSHNLDDEDIDAIFGIQAAGATQADGGQTEENTGASAGRGAEGVGETRQGQGETLAVKERKDDPYTKDLFGGQDLFDDIAVRPGTIEAQKQAGRAAVSDLARRLGIDRINRSNREAGADVSVLGSRLLANFIAGKPNQLVGQRVATPHDLAVLAQVYRDPRFETFRAFYMKDGAIVGEAGYTSRLPAAVHMPPNLVEQMQADKARFGADEYYLLHNHPSGHAEPSQADEHVTRKLDALVPGFLGHVVIDHNEYAVIQNWGSEVHQAPHLNGANFTAIPELEHKLLGMKLSSPDAVARAAKALQVKDGFATMILTTAKGEAQLILDVPLKALDKVKGREGRVRAKALIRRMARETGSGGHRFLVLPSNQMAMAPYLHMVADGILTDVVTPDGTSAQANGAYFGGNFLNRSKPRSLRVAEDADTLRASVNGAKPSAMPAWFADGIKTDPFSASSDAEFMLDPDEAESMDWRIAQVPTDAVIDGGKAPEPDRLNERLDAIRSANTLERPIYELQSDGTAKIIDGWHRLQVAKERGQKHIEALVGMPKQALRASTHEGKTDTPAFKKWFGDSKVVDEDGKPLVVYHGTNNGNIDRFERGWASATAAGGQDFYFSSDADNASAYAQRGRVGKDGGRAVYATYLSLQDPLIMDLGPTSSTWAQVDFNKNNPMPQRLKEAVAKAKYIIPEQMHVLDGWYTLSLAEIAKYAKLAGYDGLIAKNVTDGGSKKTMARQNTYVVFHPEQIKSATGNNGDFDPANPDIRAATAPTASLMDSTVAELARDGTSASELLRAIADQSDNADFRALAAALQAQGLKTTVKFGRPGGGTYAAGVEAADATFSYRQSDDTAFLHQSQGAEQGLLHELTHAATLNALARGGNAARQIKELYSHVKALPNFAREYGIANAEEFVAEAFTSPRFRQLLADTPAPGVKVSLWQKLVGVVKMLLGRPALADNVLARVMDLQGALFDENHGHAQAHDERLAASTATGARTADAIGNGIRAATLTEIPKKIGNRLADFRNLALQALGRRQLVDLYARDFAPEGKESLLQRYSDLMQRMDADKNEAGAEADSIADRWGKLADADKLADLMHDATLAQIDPAKDYAPGGNRAEWSGLKNRLNALSPEAKAIYSEARDAYAKHWSKVRAEIRARILRAIPESPRRAALLEKMDATFYEKVKGVYFPLARFGDYVVTVSDQDGARVSVNFAETLNEADALRRALLKKFPASSGHVVSKVTKKREFNAGRDAVSRGFMQELFGVLDQYEESAELVDDINQLYLNSLPDLSWAKHGIHRKGTPGFSQDARRAFAQNLFHGARYLAKLRYADRLGDLLTDMQDHVDGKAHDAQYDSVKAQQVVDEMTKRHESYLNPQTNPLSNTLTSLGFIFYLGLSPASAAVNLTQTPLVTLPMLAAKHGFAKASAALLKASQQAAANRNDISKVLTGDEKRAFDEAVAAGVIDVSLAHDLAGIAAGDDNAAHGKLRPVMKWASFLFHHGEKFNRQATLIAAYRLARDAGQSHEAAYKSAVEETYASHFDYSAGNRARVMQGDVARVVLLFKQYSQNMIYTLARSAVLATKGDKVALKTFAGLMVSHALAAGVLGLPLVGTLLAVASALGGDDDDPWDAKVALRNALADLIGQKPAELLMHGVSRATPFDISGRVGLDKLLLPDVQEGLEGARAAEAWMTAALGPVAALGTSTASGLQSIAHGDYLRGLEGMMPSALRGPLKAIRYASQGVKDKSGISILDDTTAVEEFGQALGFSPSRAREAMEGKSAVVHADRTLNQRRAALVEMWAHARMAGDEEGVTDAREAIQRFNDKNPLRRITQPNLTASLHGRNKRIREAQDGVYLPKKHRDVRELGRFAQGDD